MFREARLAIMIVRVKLDFVRIVFSVKQLKDSVLRTVPVVERRQPVVIGTRPFFNFESLADEDDQVFSSGWIVADGILLLGFQ